MSLTVGLVADTHGVLDSRVAAVVRGCDHAVHGGDVGAAAVLAGLGPPERVTAVRGNNDVAARWPPGEAPVLASLDEEARLDLPGGTLVVVHGHRAGAAARRHAWLRRRFADARAVVYGHSHRLVCDTAAEPWILNPGAAGRARTFGGPSCIVLEAGAGTWALTVHRFAPAARNS